MYTNRLEPNKINKILRHFSEDLPATKTARLLDINRNTINRYFVLFREIIYEECDRDWKKRSGDFELDEAYFGAKRVRGKRGRGASGKTPVFGLLKREGNIHVEIVKNCSRAELLPIIQGKILEGSTINTDGWKAYDSLILNGYDHHRVYHSHDEFARGKCHVNGVEAFWSFAKRRLSKFNGMAAHMFYLHLKESEFRYNNREKNLYKVLLKVTKNLRKKR